MSTATTNMNEARPRHKFEKKNTLIRVRPKTEPMSPNCTNIVPDITGRNILQHLAQKKILQGIQETQSGMRQSLTP